MLSKEVIEKFESDNASEIKLIRDIWVGKKIFVEYKEHPHYGETGTVLSFEMTNLGKPALRIKGNDNEFFVFKASYLKILT